MISYRCLDRYFIIFKEVIKWLKPKITVVFLNFKKKKKWSVWFNNTIMHSLVNIVNIVDHAIWIPVNCVSSTLRCLTPTRNSVEGIEVLNFKLASCKTAGVTETMVYHQFYKTGRIIVTENIYNRNVCRGTIKLFERTT